MKKVTAKKEPLIVGLQVGFNIYLSHGKWKEAYRITWVDSMGGMVLTRMKFPKSKIDAIRFPETINISMAGQQLGKY